MMESQTETKTQNPTTSSSNSLIEYSHEFKLEMENSIYNYFSKFKLEDDQSIKSLVRNETLVNNENKDVEYITPTPSLKGISEFMIDQIFSTDKIIPIESDDEESKLEITETVDEPSTETETDKKMSSCNSDVTLNNTVEELEKEEEKKNDNILDNEYISKSFAVEFIDLLNINMKELNSKKDDFHVIGLKNTNKEMKIRKRHLLIMKMEILKSSLKMTLKMNRNQVRSLDICLFSKLKRNLQYIFIVQNLQILQSHHQRLLLVPQNLSIKN